MNEKKEKRRRKKWSRRACVTEENYLFINNEMEEKKYKTIAGTLDLIINKYKDEKRDKQAGAKHSKPSNL